MCLLVLWHEVWYFLLLCLLRSKYRTGCEISSFRRVSLRPSLVWDKALFSCTSTVRPSLLWDNLRRRMVAGWRRFGTTYQSYLQRSRRRLEVGCRRFGRAYQSYLQRSRRRLVVGCRRFGTAYQSYLQRSRRRLVAWYRRFGTAISPIFNAQGRPLNIGRTDCPETSAPSHPPTPHKIPQQRRPHQSS